MPDKTNLARGWMENAGFPVPDADIADIFAAADDLSRCVAKEAAQLQMKDLDINFAAALLSQAAQPLPAGLAPSPVASHVSTGHASEHAVQAALDAIAASPLGKLAWRWVDADGARRAAQEKDAAVASGQARGPLHGIPVGVKDMFDWSGHTAKWGSVLREDALPAQTSATILSRLEQAGAIPLGAIHMAEFALSPTGLNSHLGPGRNPHDIERVSGGSSSGSGMVVGGRHVPLAIGSDTGGSVRLPAAFCGVVGLKPTQYRVSLAGAMPLAPTLDTIGPLANSVSLCAAAFSAMAGGDPRDSACLPLPAPGNHWQGVPASSLTLAVPCLPDDVPLSADMRRVFENTVSRLRDKGVNCVNVAMPDIALLGKLGSVILAVESAAVHRQGLSLHPDSYGRQVRRRISRGALIGSIDYFDALRLRTRMLRRFVQETLDGADALLLPVTPDIAPLVSETIGHDEAVLEKAFSQISFWVRGINYLGVPALSVPAGTGAGQMPLAVQFVGAPLGEERLFALGSLLEK